MFIRNKAGRPEAEVGQHDDLVMSLAIAHFIRGQQTATVKTSGGGNKWSRRRLEEYEAADAKTRAAMERRWGKPLHEEEDDDE